MTYSPISQITLADSSSLDSFGRLRVSNPVGLFDSQFTYDLQPLLFEQITNGTGAAIAHDSANRQAIMTFASTPTGGKAIMQSYQCFRYQPGKSQKVEVSFNFIEAKADVLKFAGYSDGTNGIEFQNNGTTNQWVIYSGTASGNQTVVQADWNLDKLNGLGPSGLTLDITKAQILVIDLQALYTGRVRVGFYLTGTIIYVHQFQNSNIIVSPYIQSANLPIRIGMTSTATVSTTMRFTCSAIESEGGHEYPVGYEFSQLVTGTAGNNVPAHIASIRPKTTFNGIANRTSIFIIEVDMIATGNNSVYWQLVLGQAITGTTTFADCNTAYSAVEYNTAGTISGSAGLSVDSGFVSSSTQSKGQVNMATTLRYPITLDAAGAQRLMGTVSLIATGIGGTSTVQATIKWAEVR